MGGSDADYPGGIQVHFAYDLQRVRWFNSAFLVAEYYLTGNIYVVDQDGVSRYHNRNPGSDLTMRDHRLQLRKQFDSDVTKDTHSVGLCNSDHKKEKL